MTADPEPRYAVYPLWDYNIPGDPHLVYGVWDRVANKLMPCGQFKRREAAETAASAYIVNDR